MDKELLAKNGINYTEGIHRFMDNEELYESTLRVFLQDQCIQNATKALMEKRLKGFRNAISELKGVTATLSIDPLYKLTSQILTMLDSSNTAQAMILFEALSYDYSVIKQSIDKATESTKSA